MSKKSICLTVILEASKMADNGVITEEEFHSIKGDILNAVAYKNSIQYKLSETIGSLVDMFTMQVFNVLSFLPIRR